MNDMKFSEAIHVVEQFKNVFKATQKIEEVLMTVRRAEKAASDAEKRKSSALSETGVLNKEIEKLKESIDSFSQKRKQDILDLDDQYQRRQEKLKSDFNDFAKENEDKKKSMENECKKAKASHDAKMHEMEKEASEISAALQNLSSTRERLKKELSLV
jgi:chromosome segregation ATPase